MFWYPGDERVIERDGPVWGWVAGQVDLYGEGYIGLYGDGWIEGLYGAGWIDRCKPFLVCFAGHI